LLWDEGDDLATFNAMQALLEKVELEVRKLVILVIEVSSTMNDYNDLCFCNERSEVEVDYMVLAINGIKSMLSNMKFVCILACNKSKQMQHEVIIYDSRRI